MNVRNEIKAQIVRTGFTMQEVVDLLHDEYGWSDSVSNLSAKLQRESIRYKEVVELADSQQYLLHLVQQGCTLIVRRELVRFVPHHAFQQRAFPIYSKINCE